MRSMVSPGTRTVRVWGRGVARVVAYEPEIQGTSRVAASLLNCCVSGVPQLKNWMTLSNSGSFIFHSS
jgi:hypothetical protein